MRGFFIKQLLFIYFNMINTTVNITIESISELNAELRHSHIYTVSGYNTRHKNLKVVTFT